LLLAAPDVRHGPDGGRLGGAHELECEVAIGMQRTHVRGQAHHGVSLTRASRNHGGFRLARVKESQFFRAGQIRLPLGGFARLQGTPVTTSSRVDPNNQGALMPVATPEQYADMLDRAKAGGFAYPAINVASSQSINAVLQ